MFGRRQWQTALGAAEAHGVRKVFLGDWPTAALQRQILEEAGWVRVERDASAQLTLFVRPP